MPDRTTVVLPAELKRIATLRARAEGISFGELVRRALESHVNGVPKKESKVPWKSGKRNTGDPFWDNLVTFDDGGPTDLSVRHDHYLYDEEL